VEDVIEQQIVVLCDVEAGVGDTVAQCLPAV
jgi:hypothetical protein